MPGDVYVRHHREQREGAPLGVRGGVLDVAAGRVRLYEELAHAETGELAATFVLAFGGPASEAVVGAAAAHVVEVPEHGRWRSISPDDDVVGTAPTFEVVVERDLAQREVRTIRPEEAGDPGAGDDGDVGAGGAAPSLSIAELVWGGTPTPGRGFQPLHRLADGGQMGFATLETRATWTRPLRAGDRVQSFGAEVDRAEKTMLTRSWVFDVDRAELVAVFSVVNVAFDLTSRRAIPIPADLRRRGAARLHADRACGATPNPARSPWVRFVREREQFAPTGIREARAGGVT